MTGRAGGGARRRGPAGILSVATWLAACSGGGGPGSGAERVGRAAPPAGGNVQWRWTAPPPAGVGLPAADERGVAVTYGHGHLVLLDAERGTVQWQVEHTGLRDVAPLLSDDLVAAATDSGVLAVERATGSPRWSAELGVRANTPVRAGDWLVATTWEGVVVALDAGTGRVAWRAAVGGDMVGPAAVAGGAVVASFDTGLEAGVVALDPATGAERWRSAVAADGVSGPGLVPSALGPTAVVVAGDATVRGIDAHTGAPRWVTEVEGAGSPEVPPVAVPGGRVLVGHRLGGLVLLDAASGAVLARWGPVGAAVRGAPAGPGPRGRVALPLFDGRLRVAGPATESDLVEHPGLVAGVALLPQGWLAIATTQGDDNGVVAVSEW